ncbi:MAG: nucleotide exchange factor GrpE [Burkholderiaceae bacterium]|nr:nucleotide exchange factor GrpE [Burkholderiaceae bacterium]
MGVGAQTAGAGQEKPGQAPDREAGAGAGDLAKALAAAEGRAREAEEQHLRALAEMENVRRRAREDVAKAHKYAIESFAESLLPVGDSLEMALSTEVPSIESLKEGVETTLRQLTQAFERNNLVVIDPLHQKFDPNRHQAISTVPSKDVAPNHVASVLQKGYLINDRVLRPALVTVSQSG